ncbi:hypothetical protein PV08_11923 [Exophiala spinifera]|uniref:DSBA-like thioredoxin domain-containing protein n=1 Tax=Exophiala spinifera TaxID=91928 RepID=A0A0D1Z9X8_9EURO|nr:uncharacterized protein PV08_11923 [Exophiala spinifera]KIW09822.1 hypothetical protein PV08_11923 [Exophiala spinifera]
MAVIKIHIVSDIICPLCFVGKRKLEKAIDLWKKTHGNSSDTFSITWGAYYLRPDAGTSEATTVDYIKQKTGMHDITPVIRRMEQLGRANGIRFKVGGRTGSTRDAHRLIYLAQTKLSNPEICDALVEGLFRRHHEGAQDISSHDILRQIAVEAGIDAGDVDTWLKSDIAGVDVDREFFEAQRQGIFGVLLFMIQGQYIVRGAQDPPAFLEVFSKVARNDSS